MSGGGNEVMLGFAWLATTLSGDSALMSNAPGGVWRGLAKPATATPFIVMTHQGGGDTTTAQGVRLLTIPTYLLKVVGPVEDVPAIAAAALRLDQLLGGTIAGPASGPIMIGGVQVGYVSSCERQSPLVLDELVNGSQWTNVGGLYRMEIQQVTN